MRIETAFQLRSKALAPRNAIAVAAAILSNTAIYVTLSFSAECFMFREVGVYTIHCRVSLQAFCDGNIREIIGHSNQMLIKVHLTEPDSISPKLEYGPTLVSFFNGRVPQATLETCHIF